MQSALELVIRGGEVVTAEGVMRADLGIADGTIAALSPELAERGTAEIDGRGLVLFPGILDAHVHFNEPGRTHWEGLATGSAALAAGGGAAFFDMPLNSLPPVLDAASLTAKRALAEEKSCLDFALWGGLTPGNLERLPELAEAGAIGFKAFLCASGVEEFEAVTEAATLKRGMRRAAELGLLVAVHAEDDALAKTLATAARQSGGCDARAWLASRPVEVELAGIRTALDAAGETGCRLHIVHVSSPEGLALIREAKRQGVDVTAETCPHYLLLNEEDVLRLGAPAKCAPPLRDEGRRQALWAALLAGEVETVGSDHSPAPPELKTAPNFFDIWGGISGCQHGFPLFLSEALARAPAAEVLPRLALLLAGNVAERFCLPPTKGRLALGYDADLALLELGGEHALSNEELFYRHRQGPYAGRRCTVRVVHTLTRGATVFSAKNPQPPRHRGRFLRPVPDRV